MIRHVLAFQFKLLADALRDFIFSPISLVAALIDTLFRPNVNVGDSYSYKLMMMGRQSDRVINLFGEFSTSEDFTLDETVTQLESAVQSELNKRRDV